MITPEDLEKTKSAVYLSRSSKSDASIKHKYRADALESELQAAKAEIQDLKAAMEDRDEMHAQQVQTLDADRLRTRGLLEDAQVALEKIAGGRTTAIEGDPRGICWEHQIIAHEALIKLRAERGWK